MEFEAPLPILKSLLVVAEGKFIRGGDSQQTKGGQGLGNLSASDQIEALIDQLQRLSVASHLRQLIRKIGHRE